MNIKPEYAHLPIDTKFFTDIEGLIIGLFDDLDSEIDGYLVNSENYQFLNSSLLKFSQSVKLIYIDPPFNLDSSDQFLYRTNYKDANWATLLENRIRLAWEFLRDDGAIVVRCDYNGNWIVRPLLEIIFGRDNFRNEISIRRFRKNTMNKSIKKLPAGLDTLFVFSKSDRFEYLNPVRPTYKKREGFWRHMGDSSGQGTPKKFFGKVLPPPSGKHWKYSQEKIDKMIQEGLIILECKVCGYRHNDYKSDWQGCPTCGNDNPQPKYWVNASNSEVLDTNWVDIYGYSTQWEFSTENSEKLLLRIIECATTRGDYVMDFFLGSGTTIAVAHKLGRKWIGVEMGEHFWTVVLPRMKKVLAGDKSGISNEVGWQGGGFFKYYCLEQYEDTLRKAHYEDADLFVDIRQDPYHSYVFLRDLKMLDALEIQDEHTITFHPERLYENIDLAETLSNLKGKWIRRLTKAYVEFEDGERVNLVQPNWQDFKPLIWW